MPICLLFKYLSSERGRSASFSHSINLKTSWKTFPQMQSVCLHIRLLLLRGLLCLQQWLQVSVLFSFLQSWKNPSQVHPNTVTDFCYTLPYMKVQNHQDHHPDFLNFFPVFLFSPRLYEVLVTSQPIFLLPLLLHAFAFLTIKEKGTVLSRHYTLAL